MSLTLTSNIDDAQRTIGVTGTVPAECVQGYRFRIDDELFELTTFELHEVQYPTYRQMDPDPQTWNVVRAVDGVPATHTAGATIKGAVDAFVSASGTTPPDPFADGGPGGPVAASDVSVSPEVAGASDVQSALEASGVGLSPYNPVILADCQHALWSDDDALVQTLPAYTYDNGTLGVGSTMTANANAALVVDGNAQAGWAGTAPEVGDRIAVADANNDRWGIFTVTDVGADDPGGRPWVLTRATDADTAVTFCRYWAVHITAGDVVTHVPARMRSYGVIPGESLDSFSGNDNNFQLESTYAQALGKGSIAIGVEPVALGYCANAIGARATAVGTYAHAIGQGAFAFGNTTESTPLSNDEATALGDHVTATLGTVLDGVLSISVPKLLSVQSSSPVGGSYSTPVVQDDTGVTGGLYIWLGSDYVKVSGPLP